MWRIIGIFKNIKLANGKTNSLIKIIRNEEIDKYCWDENYNNNRHRSTLKEYLNNEYYESLPNNCKKYINEILWDLSGWNTSLFYANDIYDIDHGKSFAKKIIQHG